MNEELEFLRWFNGLSQLEHAAFSMKVRERCYSINKNGVDPSCLIEVMKNIWRNEFPDNSAGS